MKIRWQELLLERQTFFFFLKPEVLPSVCLEGRNPASWKYVECIQLGIDNQNHLENILCWWTKIVSHFYKTSDSHILFSAALILFCKLP